MNRTEQEIPIELASLGEVVGALAFAAETPVSIQQIRTIYADVTGSDAPPSVSDVQDALNLLNVSFEKGGHPLRIQSWAGGLRMATTESVSPFLESYFQREQTRRLTKPIMETLAIIAYRQPSTRAEVDVVRGVDSGYSIRKLLSLDLIAITGRADAPGRPILYATTNRFLEEFGLNDLDGLPNLRQVEELLEDAEFDQERIRRFMSNGLTPDDQNSTISASGDQIIS